MKFNTFHKILLGTSALVLLGGISSFATTEQNTSVDSQIDNVAPVFSQNIKKRHVLKKVDDGSKFVPEKVITDVKATDNVDGKNVNIEMVDHNVDLTQDGIYQVIYTATDKAGNMSALCIEVIVDGIAPSFSENLEDVYYINHSGVILDSNHNIIEKLPEMLTATDALGAYAGIGIYLTDINGEIVFIQKVDDTPADKVLEVNDVLVSVDGEDVRGKTAAYAASKVKGEEGTIVTLGILRNGEKKTVEIEREIIKLYGEEDCIAEPNVDITNIDIKNDGIIEITYTATDQAGNTATKTIKVIVGDVEEDKTTDNQEQDVETSEKLEDITTGENPPEDVETIEDENDDIENKEVNNATDIIEKDTINDEEEIIEDKISEQE